MGPVAWDLVETTSLIGCSKTMAKRMQEQKEEEIIVPFQRKIRLHQKAREYSEHLQGNLTRARKIQNPTQRRVFKEGWNMLILAVDGWETCRDRNHGTFLNLNHGAFMRKKWQGNLLHSEIQKIQAILKLEAENGHIIFHLSAAVVPHMEKVSSIAWQIFGRSPTDDLNAFEVNNAFWCIFMNVTLQAAVHLGRDNMENLRFTTNQLLKSVKQFFQVTERLIKDQTEFSCLTTIDYTQPSWRSTTLLCDPPSRSRSVSIGHIQKQTTLNVRIGCKCTNQQNIPLSISRWVANARRKNTIHSQGHDRLQMIGCNCTHPNQQTTLKITIGCNCIGSRLNGTFWASACFNAFGAFLENISKYIIVKK